MLLTTELQYPDSPYSQKDYVAFYQRHVLEFEERKFPQYKGFCPFHQDRSTPNLSVNVVNGGFKCFACGVKGGHLDFLMKLYPETWKEHEVPDALTNHEALAEIEDYRKNRSDNIELDRALDCRLAETAHDLLLKQPTILKKIAETRGFTLETVKTYHIGWLRGSITIPICDIENRFVTLKVHKKYQTDGAENQLYPWCAFSSNYNYVILQEGEPDTILARQLGFNAVTQILGCNSWQLNFNKFFNNKTVYIAYDNDLPGQLATNVVANEILKNSNALVYKIVWPSYMTFSTNHGEDTTDFFMKHKKTGADYTNLLSKAKHLTLQEVFQENLYETR
jgi:DNA primase